ncbi:MAG: hypothetical protein ACI4E1_10775 [Lachnospira sp.]
MAKKICWGLLAIIILVLGVRIVYVNATYPSARFKNVDSSDELKYKDCSIKINKATYYSKSQWSDYAKTQNFKLENEKYNIKYISNVNENDEYDYLVSYDPDADYYVLTVTATIRNDSDEDISYSYTELMKIVESKMSGSEYLNSYYFCQINDMKSSEASQLNLKAGAVKTVTYAYVMNEKKPKLYAQIIDLNGYQLMKLDIEDKQ